MNTKQQAIAHQCLEGAENGSMTFPHIVGTLIEAGFDGYLVDLRLGQATYYLPESEGLVLATRRTASSVAAHFDAGAVVNAIRQAQALVPGYTYLGFCEQVKHAGCAGYLVSLLGRRVLYFGRTAETHVEYFPQ